MQNEELYNREFSLPPLKEKVSLPENPTPDNPPWNGWVAIGVWIMSVVFIAIFPIIFLAPYVIKSGTDLSDKAALSAFLLNDKTSILLQLLSVIPAHIFTLLLAWFVATNFKKFSFQQTLGWDWGGFKIWHAFAITIFFFALAIASKAVFPEQENEMDKILKSSQAAVFLVAFFATFTAPLVEEVVYRGILYSALQRKFGIILSVVFVTILFAAVHVPQYSSNNVPDYGTILLLLLLSLVLTLIRVKTKNLLPCIVLHTVFNGIQSVLLISQLYLPSLIENNHQNVQETPALIIQLLKLF